ncbi:hypothetical protein ACLK19_21700 [Escherichia coli]
MKVAVLGAAGGIGQALARPLSPNCLQVQNSLMISLQLLPAWPADLSHIPTAVKIKGFSGEDATPRWKAQMPFYLCRCSA